MSNTGYDASGIDLINIYDTSMKSTLTQNQSTEYVCNSTGKDLGNIFTLFSSLSGTDYTGIKGANCNLLSGGKDIGSLFININTISTVNKGVLSSIPSGCQGLYSCNWINNNYKGPIFKIRKSLTTQDFYVDYRRVITTGINGTGISLSSWIGAATPYVDTWYDQSGNTTPNNATQSNLYYQPVFDQASYSIDFSNNKYFDIPDGTVPYGNTNYTISFKLASTSGTYGVILGSGGGGQATKDSNIVRMEASRKFRNWWDGNQVNDWITSGTLANNTCILAYNNTANTLTGYYNGTQIGSSISVDSRNSTSSNNYIGNGTYYFAGQYLNSKLYSISIFNTTLSSTTDINTLNLI